MKDYFVSENWGFSLQLISLLLLRRYFTTLIMILPVSWGLNLERADHLGLHESLCHLGESG